MIESFSFAWNRNRIKLNWARGWLLRLRQKNKQVTGITGAAPLGGAGAGEERFVSVGHDQIPCHFLLLQLCLLRHDMTWSLLFRFHKQQQRNVWKWKWKWKRKRTWKQMMSASKEFSRFRREPNCAMRCLRPFTLYVTIFILPLSLSVCSRLLRCLERSFLCPSSQCFHSNFQHSHKA